MNPATNHPWNLPEAEALELQQALAAKVIKEDQFNAIKLVAGVDVAYAKESDKLIAAVAV